VPTSPGPLSALVRHDQVGVCPECASMADLWQADSDEYDRRVRVRNERWAQRDAQRYDEFEADYFESQESCGTDPIDDELLQPSFSSSCAEAAERGANLTIRCATSVTVLHPFPLAKNGRAKGSSDEAFAAIHKPPELPLYYWSRLLPRRSASHSCGHCANAKSTALQPGSRISHTTRAHRAGIDRAVQRSAAPAGN
jgi:hypothetical protein